jgi:hypothetical protein
VVLEAPDWASGTPWWAKQTYSLLRTYSPVTFAGTEGSQGASQNKERVVKVVMVGSGMWSFWKKLRSQWKDKKLREEESQRHRWAGVMTDVTLWPPVVQSHPTPVPSLHLSLSDLRQWDGSNPALW